MSEVPAIGTEYTPATKSMVGITVYPLSENKRPVGFAPWPEEPKPKRKPRPKRPAKRS